MEIINIATSEKLITYQDVIQTTAGATTNPDRFVLASKWSNTSVQISSIQAKASSGTLNAGSVVIVLGHD